MGGIGTGPKKTKAERRWSFLKDKYPRRYLEFFEISTHNHVPLERGVEFLVTFGDLGRAQEITEASVRFAESLMADMQLTQPAWVEDADAIDVIDILLQRLLWPSPLVRERAAVGIADLLINDGPAVGMRDRLLNWIHTQRIESTAAIGLLPLLRAAAVCRNGQRVIELDLGSVIGSLSVNSVVICYLLDELGNQLGDGTVEDLPEYRRIEAVPADYTIGSFFTNHIKTFLAPIYWERAQIIERESGVPFTRMWAWTSECIIQELSITPSVNQVYFYGRSEHDEFLSGFSTKLSEVYRSAFLRVLHSCYATGAIDANFHLMYAFSTLPVELSRWSVPPGRAPRWWPQLKERSNLDGSEEPSDGSSHLQTIELREPIEAMIRASLESTGETLLAIEGAIEPSEGWQSADPEHSLSVIGFGYRTLGPSIPEGGTVAKNVAYGPSLLREPTMTRRPLNFWEDQDCYMTTCCGEVGTDDLVILPLVAREKVLCIALWQYFRDYDASLHLNVPLAKGLRLVVTDKGWQYVSRSKQVVARYSDWLEGLKERYNREMPIPHGQFLSVDNDFLTRWLSARDLRLGYLLRVTYRTRRYSHSEVNQYEDCRLLNVSSIITV